MHDLSEAALVGQAFLVENLRLAVPPPAVTSSIGPGARRTVVDHGRRMERYPVSYMPTDELAGHLKFALRYEPVDLGVLAATFSCCDPREIERWVRQEPTGAYARRAWFLYEWLTGSTLDVEDAGAVAYVDALDPALNVVARSLPSRRHKVRDNLLGRPDLCPFVRRTEKLDRLMATPIDEEARALVAGCEQAVLTRAVNWLYTKETKSSFEIEHETATGKRAERFVAALRSAPSFDPADAKALVDLQNAIVDPRYAATGFRDFQNFVGETVGPHREIVHFICPKPEDVDGLMASWAALAERLQGAVNPVVAAAVVAFSFVFLHPFEDGNGRIHRFLIHQVLSREGFTPPGVLFPVSAAIVRDPASYDRALEAFSRAIQPFIDWQWAAGLGPQREIEVLNSTDRLYRYFDATAQVEFLYEKVLETVRVDLKDELAFVNRYDAALNAVREAIDMPDRRASLFVRLAMQNHGRISRAKRSHFQELSDDDIGMLEQAVQSAIAEIDAPPTQVVDDLDESENGDAEPDDRPPHP